MEEGISLDSTERTKRIATNCGDVIEHRRKFRIAGTPDNRNVVIHRIVTRKSHYGIDLIKGGAELRTKMQ